MSSFTIRPMQPDELAFVTDSWLRSYCDFFNDLKRGRMSCIVARSRNCMPADAIKLHSHIVAALTNSQQVSIAVHQDEPDVILGWCCHGVRQDGRKVVHY